MISRRISSSMMALAMKFAVSQAAHTGARLKVIYSPQNATSPGGASGALVVDKNGNLYAAGSGGSGVCQDVTGGALPCGTLYRLAPPTSVGAGWTPTELYSFQGPKSDGQSGSGRF